MSGVGHVSTAKEQPQVQEMASSKAQHHYSSQDTPALCPTDDETIAPKASEATSRNSQIDKHSTEYILKTLIAGGLAGCAAKTAVGPLDRVKILFQASNPKFQKYTGSTFGVVKAMRHIYQVSGTRGLFRGHSATLIRIFPYAGIKFLAYEQIRILIIKDKSQETPGRRFASGSIAGCISVFFTYPLEVIRVRLAFDTNREKKSGLSTIVKEIYHERPPLPSAPDPALSSLPRTVASTAAATTSTAQDLVPRRGLANFYRGFTPTLWGMLPYAGSSFLVHDTMGDILRHPSIAEYTTLPRTRANELEPNKRAQLTSWAQLTAGGVAGFASQTCSYPLEVLRRRMQVGGVVGDGHRLRMGEVAKTIWAERGVRGFFVGLTIGYAKVIPMVAVSFYAYERGKYYLGIG